MDPAVHHGRTENAEYVAVGSYLDPDQDGVEAAAEARFALGPALDPGTGPHYLESATPGFEIGRLSDPDNDGYPQSFHAPFELGAEVNPGAE